MTREELEQKRASVKPMDENVRTAVKKHWDHLAKPLDGLGIMEQLLADIGGIQRKEIPDIRERTLLIFLSDNGIVEEGVSQSDASVTHQVGLAMSENRSTVCIMARRAHISVYPVDMGMQGEKIPGIKDMRVRSGSRNFAKEPAMTVEETLAAMENGYLAACECIREKPGLLLLGEMGIGNTSTATALSAAFLGVDPGELTGRGAGLSDEQLIHKCKVLQDALRDRTRDTSYDPADPVGILAAFGGYDIAGMVGAILAGAELHTPVVLDGLITLAGAFAAEKLFPGIRQVLIPSHTPKEPMGRLLLEQLGLSAPIDAGLKLGEGTGGVLLVPMLDVCMELYKDGIGFDTLGIDAYTRFDRNV